MPHRSSISCLAHLTWAPHTYFAVVYTDDATDHFGDDDHVAEVGLDDGGFLIRESLFFGFAEFLDEAHWAALEAAVELAACTGMDELEKEGWGWICVGCKKEHTSMNCVEGSRELGVGDGGVRCGAPLRCPCRGACRARYRGS